MILTHTHVLTRIMYRPTLANYDVPRLGNLTAEELYPQSFTMRITTVPRTADSFLMCHIY